MDLEQRIRNREEEAVQLQKGMVTKEVEVGLLEQWRTRSGEYFREKYDFENTRVSRLQVTNKLLQNQIAAANA